jgi:hypothetical protein
MNEDLSERSTKSDDLEEFLVLLNRFRQACGPPSLRELSRVSEQVCKYYGARYPKLPTILSLSALSEVLSHRRKRPPTWQWVASFVLSCQRHAAEAGIRPDPEDTTLPIWHLRLRAVYQPEDIQPPPDEEIVPGQASDPARPPRPRSDSPWQEPAIPVAAYKPPASVEEAVQDHAERGSGPQSGSAQTVAIGPSPAEPTEYVGDPRAPTLSEQRFFVHYGLHGVQLLRAAEGARDQEAEYRLGVLLCIDNRPHEALAFLMRAEASGHPKARELIESAAPRRTALVHAWRLGTCTAVDYETKLVYLERAAINGHAGAAFDLGTLHMEREDPERASWWFAIAANYGHPSASAGRSGIGKPGSTALEPTSELQKSSID